ncbi:MAG TPA: vWA domain-containing protein [Blastocatellia bacterium]|nr:vWA domain-containing protein [Blastocatellia bacterium]
MKKVLLHHLLLLVILLGILQLGHVGAQKSVPAVEAQKPVPADERKTLELVFAIDTTGSMGGLIEGAKQRVWGIVNEVMQIESKPHVRVGLVAYRDRGDQYVTQITPLTDDLDAVYTKLMDFQAGGGGDTPENVRRALADAVQKSGWSQSSSEVAKILFLVGDAPPHEDYQDEPDTATTVEQAVRQNMIVNTIQCGNIEGTRAVWQSIALRGEGKYFAIAQDGGVAVIQTPYDEKLGQLSNQLGGTFMAYGEAQGQMQAEARQAGIEGAVAKAAPSVAQADRALNKAMNSVAYAGDFLQGLENGSLKLEAMKEDQLPLALRKLSAAERQQEIDKRLAQRKQIREQIMQLSKQRADFIESERKKQTGQTGFDAAVSEALKSQLAAKGIR